jgi:Peptidase family S64
MSRNAEHFVENAPGKWNDLREARAALAQRFIHGPRAEAARRLDGRNAALAAVRAVTGAITPNPTENVVGVGIGEKISDGRQTGALAVKFLVRMKYAQAHMDGKQALPRDIDGIPTDVEEVGTFRRLAGAAARRRPAGMPNPRTKFRPAHPGCSVGFQDPAGAFTMAGTFGAVVKDRSGIYVLSNNHVLADENQLPIGAPIFQPGLLDGGNASTDQIASLTRFVRLDPTKPNSVDCAIAKATSASIVSNQVLHIGAPAGVAAAAIDMSVHKFGRTTGYTVGRVTSVDTDVTVGYEMGNVTFSEQIIIVGNAGTAFSKAGDSGSLILERGTNEAVGLLFAGSSTHTIANHLEDVLKALAVTLA